MEAGADRLDWAGEPVGDVQSDVFRCRVERFKVIYFQIQILVIKIV